MRKFGLLLVLASFISGCGGTNHGGLEFSVQRLSLNDAAFGTGMNNAGHIVGYTLFQYFAPVSAGNNAPNLSDAPTDRDTFFWDSGSFNSIGWVGNHCVINDLDQVVGVGWQKIALWDGNSVTELHDFSPSFPSIGGMNDSGQVVGTCNNQAFMLHGGLTYLDGLSGAYDINESGVITGTIKREYNSHAVIWNDGQITELGELAGHTRSCAYAINDHGTIAGVSGPQNMGHAVLWHDGQVTDLGTLGGNSSYATDLNEENWVVGYSKTASAETHAFLWINGKMYDLNDLADLHDFPESRAIAVNDNGQILVSAIVGATDTPSQTLLLTPEN